MSTRPDLTGAAEWSGDEIRHPDRDVHRERFGQGPAGRSVQCHLVELTACRKFTG